MLVPLETLSGWPAVPNPSVLQFTLLLIGAPLLLSLVIAGLSFRATTHAEARFGPPVNPSALAIGAATPAIEGAAGSGRVGIEAKAPDEGTGGTSARW